MQLRRIAAALSLGILAVGCTGGSGDETATTTPSDGSASATISPVPANTLTAEVLVEADVPVTAKVSFSGDVDGEARSSGDASTELRIPVVGMHPESSYDLEVEVLDEEGRPVATEGSSGTFETGSIPDTLPPIELVESDPDEVSPGVTMFSILDFGTMQAEAAGGDQAVEPTRQRGTIMIVDETGTPIWYLQAPRTLADARQLDNGNLLVEYEDIAAWEVNLFGEVVREWGGRVATDPVRLEAAGRPAPGPDVIRVDADSMHHEHGVLPNGNHLTISTELRVVEGFAEPLCGEDPASFDGTYHLVGDVVYEFEPDTGEVVREFNLFDYYDPTVSYSTDICDGPAFVFPNNLYRIGDPEAEDWTHANSAILDEERNALIISVRHLDEVIAIRYSDDDEGGQGDVLWRLGANGDLELADGGFWAYHQHAAEVWPDDSVLVYDNGNGRPDLPGSPSSTRIVRYEIDDEAGTVEQVWEFDSLVDGQDTFSAFVGDADLLENGNVLVSDGGLIGVPDDVSAQITEVVPEEPEGGKVVWQLRLIGGGAWGSYRAERIPTLYP